MTDKELEDFFWKKLGWCGCGRPKEALTQMKRMLTPMKKTEPLFPEYHSDKLGGNDGAITLIWYHWANIGLMEHGGSVPGWLTEKGLYILEQIESGRVEATLDV